MATRARKKHVQLTLDAARRPTGRGGWRPNAGRPRGERVQHVARATFRADKPQHVTLRLVAGVPSLRRGRLARIVRDAIRGCHKPWFRVVHFAVLSNHVHVIAEAADAPHLARGVQGLAVRIARRVNHALERRGALFVDRYHARALSTPREVRNCLRYVLLNQRHHVAERVLDRDWIDPCSSAAWFDGWTRALVVDAAWKHELLAIRSPVVAATSWLLTTGWRRHGLIAVDEPMPHGRLAPRGRGMSEGVRESAAAQKA